MNWIMFVIVWVSFNGNPIPLTGSYETREQCIEQLTLLQNGYVRHQDGLCFIVTDIPTPRVGQ